MTCKACQSAEANPQTGFYTSDCQECKARALAQGIELYESRRAGVKSPAYAEALRKVFGAGNEEAGHERVKHWHKKAKEGRLS